MVLFNVDITIQLFYLIGLLFVLYEGLKGLEYVNNKYILLYLLVISIGINFIFYGISIKTLFVGVTAMLSTIDTMLLSFVVLIKEICKVLKH